MVEHQSERGHRSRVPTIRELIQDAIDSGKSVRDLSAASGDRVKHQTFQELSKRAPKQFPKESKTISGMSAANRRQRGRVLKADRRGAADGQRLAKTRDQGASRSRASAGRVVCDWRQFRVRSPGRPRRCR